MEHKIIKVSRRMHYFLLILVAIIPVVDITICLLFNSLPAGMMQGIIRQLPVEPSLPVPLNTRLLFLAVTVLPLAIFIWMLRAVIRLLHFYENGIFFTGETVMCIYRIGMIIMLSVPAGIITEALSSIVLTLDRGAGHRLITIGFSSKNFSDLITGLLIILISWLMDEGRKMKEEQDLTV